MPLLVAGLLLGAGLGLRSAGVFPGRAPVAAAPSPVASGDPLSTTEVRLGDAGSMHVVTTLTFPSARTSLELSVPRRDGVGAEFAPVVTMLQVRNATSGPVPTSLDTGAAASIRLASPSTRVVLEYDVAGAVRRTSEQDTPERALALVTPLVVAQAADLPASVELPSVKVLNVGCLRGSELTGCGTRTGRGWTVEASGGPGQVRFDVLAQLNLATP